MRVLGFLLGGFFAVSLAILLFVWISFDSGRAGNSLIQYFHDQYQRTLRLGEVPRLRMRPFPVLELRKISLSEPGKGEVFASLDALSLDLELMPLLLRQTVIKSASLRKADIHLVRKPNGSWNASDLLAGGAGLQALPWQAQLERFELTESQLSFDDQGTASHFVLSDVSLSTGALLNNLPGTFALRGQALGSTATGDEVKLRAEGHYVLHERLVAGRIDQLRVHLDGDAFGLKGATGSLQAAGLIWREGGQRLDVAGGLLSLRGALGEQALDFSAELPAFGREGVGVQGKDWKARLVVRARERETRVEGSLPALLPTTEGFRADALAFKLDHRAGKQALALELASPLAVDFKQGTLSVSNAQGKLAAEHTALRGGKASLPVKAKFAWRMASASQPAVSNIDLVLSRGRDALAFNGELQSLWPLDGRLDLSSSRLDLDSLFVPAGFQEVCGNALPALATARLNGKLSLMQLRLAGGLRLASLKAPLALAKGSLALAGLQAELYTGKLDGDLAVDAASGNFDFKGEFGEIALAPLAKDLQQRLPFSGDFGGSYAFTGQFKPGVALGESLQGAVRWKLQNGALQGFDLARSLRDFRGAIRAGKATARTPAASEVTPISSASSRFVFDHGKLVAESVAANNDWLSLNGSGSADLKAGEIDFALAANLLPKITTSAARDLADLRGKPLPIRLKGKPANPDVRFEPGLKIVAPAANGKAAPNKASR